MSGHCISQSTQFFGGFQLQISIDHNSKQNWVCTSCGCNNMGRSKLCGLCGALNPKYIVKPRDVHKQSMVKKERTKLLSAKDIFAKLSKQFPHFTKYKNISSLKRRKSKIKPSTNNIIDNLGLDFIETSQFPQYGSHIQPQHELKQSDNSDTNNIEDNTISSFMDSVFGNINFNNPFGCIQPVVIDDDDDEEVVPIQHNIPPTIISDEDCDDSDLPPGDLGDTDDQTDNEGDIRGCFSFLSLNDRLNNNIYTTSQNITDNKLPNKLQPKHVRQHSMSAPTTPPSRSDRFNIKIDYKSRPLILGVIHTPSPSKKNRIDIVMKNIENIVKFEFDGVFFINHGYSANQLVPIIKTVHSKYPSLWLGANFMGVGEKKVFKFVKTHKLHKILNGVWCENSGIALDPDELEDIFVNNFYEKERSFTKFSNVSQDLIMVDDTKEDVVMLNGGPICNLIESTSNISAVSSGSTKSIKSTGSGSGTGSNHNKKRVTFSQLANNLINEEQEREQKENKNNNNNNKNYKNYKSYNKIKKDDGFARQRLMRIRKYKFNGLYFGGVDLKASKCIKVPTQKTIRTRRRTYSADVGRETNVIIDRSKSPKSNNNNNIYDKTPRSKSRPRGKTTPVKSKKKKKKRSSSKMSPKINGRKITQKKWNITPNRKIRSNSHALSTQNQLQQERKTNNTIQRNSIKRKSKDKGHVHSNGITLKKSLSTHDIDDNNVLATISSDECNEGDAIPTSPPSLSSKTRTPSKKTKKTPLSGGITKYHITPKWKKNKNKNKNKNLRNNNNNNNNIINNNNNGRGRSRNKHKSYHNKSKTPGPLKRNDNNKYSMTEPEDNDIMNSDEFTLSLDASFWSPPSSLAVARSLELTEVEPKSPVHCPYDDDGMESPPPLPSTPSPPSHSGHLITTDNIKMHNLDMHRPMYSEQMIVEMDMMSPPRITNINEQHHNGHIITTSHFVDLGGSSSHSQDSVNSTHSINSDIMNGADAGSVYSHTSQLSETWSEYGSVAETLDDYFRALNKLGKFASDGYMHVITTSGKGKNIDIKLKALNEACSKKCLLAVASGVRIENLDKYLPYVDILMVSTCISHDFHLYDPRKMSKFKRTIDQYFKQK